MDHRPGSRLVLGRSAHWRWDLAPTAFGRINVLCRLVLFQDKNGKICRAEWRLDRKDHDVGGFGQGIDTVFASSVRWQTSML